MNQRLGKAEFDCANLDSEYDCGCRDEPTTEAVADDMLGEGTLEDIPEDRDRPHDEDELTGVELIKGGR